MTNRFCLLTVLLIVHLTLATTQDGISLRQDTPWQNTNSQSSGSAQGADYDPHDFVPDQYSTVRIIHAALMSIVFLVLFPIGAIFGTLIHVRDMLFINWKFHAWIQMVAFWIFIAAAGMGIWMAKEIDQLHTYHPTIGIFMLALMSLQPATEIVNHIFWNRRLDLRPNLFIVARIHIWLGRVLLLVGLIQGGLGLLFAASFPKAVVDTWPRVAYGVVATVAYMMYMVVGIFWKETKGLKEAKKRRNESIEMDNGRMEWSAVVGDRMMNTGHNYHPMGDTGRL